MVCGDVFVISEMCFGVRFLKFFEFKNYFTFYYLSSSVSKSTYFCSFFKMPSQSCTIVAGLKFAIIIALITSVAAAPAAEDGDGVSVGFDADGKVVSLGKEENSSADLLYSIIALCLCCLFYVIIPLGVCFFLGWGSGKCFKK